MTVGNALNINYLPNELLYAAAVDTLSGLATGNNGVLITSAGGVPSISSTLPLTVQTNITELGTITTGVWNGTLLSPTYGGTGINNGVNTLTLAGSLSTIGAHTAAFTFTGNTTVTFPTTGTLATTAGASGIVNPGLINQVAYYAAAGSTVSGLATGNNGVLITSGAGLPSISSTLPSAVQGNITATGALASGSLMAGFTPVTVPLGGTGNTTFTAYSVICAGTTPTGTFQNVTGLGTNGYVLTSNGAGGLPTWQSTGAVTGVASVSGTALQIDVAPTTGNCVVSIDTGYVGQTSITTLGTIATGTWSATNIALNKGGTNASLVASNGGIFYSTATAGAILAGTATANQMLQSGSSTTPAWSTSTWPATTTINQLLYSNAANAVVGLATANSAALVTTAAGVPVMSGTMTNGQIIIGSTGATPVAASLIVGSYGLGVISGAGSLQIIQNIINLVAGRLTLATGAPVADVSGATTLYYTPYKGTDIMLYSGTPGVWSYFQTPEISITNAGLAASTMYDVFAFANVNTVVLELDAWTNDTTRATALVYQDGVLCKTGALGRRYLGSLRTDAATHFNNAPTLRNVWNYYNRVQSYIYNSSAASWSYQNAAIRQCNASASFQINFVQGVAEDSFQLQATLSYNQQAGSIYNIGFGIDTTTAFSQSSTYSQMTTIAGNQWSTACIGFISTPQLGYHFLSLNEQSTAGTGTTVGNSTQAIIGQMLS